MTKEEFKARWESNEQGGGITNEDIANCAIAWGISQHPRTRSMTRITYLVLKAANTIDYKEWSDEDE